MKGFEVTVADGAKPPIDKACGEGLMPDTMAALHHLGVAICPDDGRVFRGVRFVDAATSVEADFSRAGGFGVRRTVLHQKMVERAQECGEIDRKSTRLNSSHQISSYAVFCLKKKNKQ